MITDFEWSARFDYDTQLIRFKVVRVLYARVGSKPHPECRRHYKMTAMDQAGIEWTLCTFSTDGPLTNEERKHVIDMAQFHPTMGVRYVKRC